MKRIAKMLVASSLVFSSAQAAIIGVQAEDGTDANSAWTVMTQATIDSTIAPLNGEILGGGSAIYNGGTSVYGANAANSIDYTFDVDTAGSYRLWLRYILPDGQGAPIAGVADGNDSVYYLNAINADTSVSGNFAQLTGNSSTPNEVVYVQLGFTQSYTAGANIFAFAPRESSFILDGFVVTDEAFNETAFDTALAVPEPAALGLVSIAGIGILFIRRILSI